MTISHILNRQPTAVSDYGSPGVFVNTPLAKAGGFGLRLKAGSIGPSADYRRHTTVPVGSTAGIVLWRNDIRRSNEWH